MPIRCEIKQRHGAEQCFHHCAALGQWNAVEFVAVSAERPLPPPRDDRLEVVVLDMHHRRPSLGYDSILFALRDAVCDFTEPLRLAQLKLRVLAYDVRHDLMVPKHEAGRFLLYIGSGGPGHLDPRLNDGIDPVSQGIQENPAWLQPYGELLDSILADRQTAYLAICHSFGLLCMHLGAAAPALRGEDKGGKSSGVLEVQLNGSAGRHPWFSHLKRLSPGGRIRILDNRFYDLLPTDGGADQPWETLAVETLGVGGPIGEAIALIEFARDQKGVMPRVYGANFHPEIVGRERYRLILEEQNASGRATDEWYQERLKILREDLRDEESDRRLQLNSDYTFLGPLRFHLYRGLRQRLAALGLDCPAVHEDRVFEQVPG
jgi:hypothetical protein